eukprot:TRINITY_DN4871_c0_g1_i1.p1 TRINITY_DN4871_c0_g1~~TRINITY_DN4871_c0_g1_i1.p1  ORF type:complete len:103 (-),score=14.07 TRINITY_DN4871_c0_g1_i1:781-1089(-)
MDVTNKADPITTGKIKGDKEYHLPDSDSAMHFAIDVSHLNFASQIHLFFISTEPQGIMHFVNGQSSQSFINLHAGSWKGLHSISNSISQLLAGDTFTSTMLV